MNTGPHLGRPPRRFAEDRRRGPRWPPAAGWMALLLMIAMGACVVFDDTPGGMEAPDVTARFSADYVHLVGGNITFQTVQGTYNANCKNPAGGNFSAGTEWYAPIGGYAGVPKDWSGSTMTGKQLALVKNGSSSCAITVYALSYTCASCGGTSYTLAGGSTITLATTYAGTPMTFSPPALSGGASQDGDPFYANFDISAVAPWTSNPTINLLVSNDPSLATTGSLTASITTYSGSTSTTFVAPPDYTVNTGSTTAAVTIATNGTASTVSGGIALTYGSTPASSAAGCVFTTTAPTQTNAGIASAFAGGSACPTSGDQSWATPFHTMFIDASNFVSVGNTVPKTGYVIFQNTSSGVSSYEEISYTFTSSCSAGELSKGDSTDGGAAAQCCASTSTTLNCNGVCVNTQVDASNCGSCGHACSAATPVCSAGSCVAQCPTGSTLCSGVCVNLQTDNNNCGSCANACSVSSDEFCNAGTCGSACNSGTFAAGYGLCSGSCTNLATSTANCGTCGNNCSSQLSGSSCVSSTCVCASGYTNCSSTCTDLATSATNCGSCGYSCTAHISGSSCVNSACVCSSGYTNCSGTCTNLTSSNTNCGSCGYSCSAHLSGSSCVSSACVCPSGYTQSGSTCVQSATSGCTNGSTTILMAAVGNSGNFGTTGAVCVYFNGNVNGWNASNINGRTVTETGSSTDTPTVSSGAVVNQPAMTAGSNGYIYWNFTAGSYTYAAMQTW